MSTRLKTKTVPLIIKKNIFSMSIIVRSATEMLSVIIRSFSSVFEGNRDGQMYIAFGNVPE